MAKILIVEVWQRLMEKKRNCKFHELEINFVSELFGKLKIPFIQLFSVILMEARLEIYRSIEIQLYNRVFFIFLTIHTR